MRQKNEKQRRQIVKLKAEIEEIERNSQEKKSK
jgi:hypothetical protein